MSRREASYKRRLRDRVCPVLTMIVAAGWAWGADWAADDVKSSNFVRVFGEAMISGMSPEGVVRGRPVNPLLPMPLLVEPAEPSTEWEAGARLRRSQIRNTEVVVAGWEYGMYGLAVLLGVLGLAGVLTRHVRFLHLLAAGVMLAGLVATIWCIRFLLDPAGGGMPPLSPWVYVVVVAAQSAYAVVLLLLFARRPEREHAPALRAT